MNKSLIRRGLLFARNLIIKGWTQGRYARDANDNGVLLRDPRACKYCLSGAITLASDFITGRDTTKDNVVEAYLYDAVEDETKGGIVHFNDTEAKSKEDVLAVLDKAIAKIPAPAFKTFDEFDLKVVVTAKDKARGACGDGTRCPWALGVERAIRRRFRRWNKLVHVFRDRVEIYDTQSDLAYGRPRYKAILPTEVSKYINNFDLKVAVPDTMEATLHFVKVAR